jgi:uncharacterized protein (DUF305 family)
MKAILYAIIAILPAFPAVAQGDFAHPAPPPADKVDEAMKSGMSKMDHGMSDAPMTGDADRDFAAMMIPHHQGAVDMARAELQYGKDPAMRQLATDIVAAQQREIAMMQRWQAAHASH